MIAVDTNILVYAHRRDSQWHEPAAASIRSLAEGAGAWSVPWPCVHEFFSIVTHPRIFSPPSSASQAIAQVDAWLQAPRIILLAESAGYWDLLRDIIARSRITGPRVHDARVAALCVFHGVQQLWTADRDFGLFPEVTAHNPLVPAS